MALPDWIGTFIEPLDRLGIVYMVTGSVGAMAYGEPRMTTDVDVVLRLASDQVGPLLDCFPEADFYRPPEEVARYEVSRAARGHFKVIQHATGMKADFYPAGDAPLPARAPRAPPAARRRRNHDRPRPPRVHHRAQARVQARGWFGQAPARCRLDARERVPARSGVARSRVGDQGPDNDVGALAR